jgi:hypothetical protein
MKKNTHPLKRKTLVILHNGSTFIKQWNFFKKILKTDTDILNNKLWLKDKEI